MIPGARESSAMTSLIGAWLTVVGVIAANLVGERVEGLRLLNLKDPKNLIRSLIILNYN